VSIHNRKTDHLSITIQGNAAYEHSAGFDTVRLKHNALPELDLDQISTEVLLHGRLFSMPVFISSMTGGTRSMGKINEVLAEVASEMNIPMGLGSQRVMLEDESSTQSFKNVRRVAPKAYIAANIGGQQLLTYSPNVVINRLVNTLQADAIIVHLNVLQEMMQPEGDRAFKGITKSIESLVAHSSVPVIVKETGAGISGSVANRLYDIGVRTIDVAGSGGTSWAKVENIRTGTTTSKTIFNEWGIPTTQCLLEIEALNLPDLTLIASGGVRSSVDILKSVALGASMAAMAQPIIQELDRNGKMGLMDYFTRLKEEIRIGMLLLGVSKITDLNTEHIYGS
jgi:isopentenyl-diphosphate Delta-isomerase